MILRVLRALRGEELFRQWLYATARRSSWIRVVRRLMPAAGRADSGENFGFVVRATMRGAGASAPVDMTLRRRVIARACNCETRDSFTPIASPICFIVASPK